MKKSLSWVDEKVIAVTLDHLIQKKDLTVVYVWNMEESHALVKWLMETYPHITVDDQTVCSEADYVLVYGMVTSNIHARVQYYRIGV